MRTEEVGAYPARCCAWQQQHRPLPGSAGRLCSGHTPPPAHLQGVAVEGEDLEADEAAEEAEDGHKGAVQGQVPAVHDQVEDRVAQALPGGRGGKRGGRAGGRVARKEIDGEQAAAVEGANCCCCCCRWWWWSGSRQPRVSPSPPDMGHARREAAGPGRQETAALACIFIITRRCCSFSWTSVCTPTGSISCRRRVGGARQATPGMWMVGGRTRRGGPEIWRWTTTAAAAACCMAGRGIQQQAAGGSERWASPAGATC